MFYKKELTPVTCSSLKSFKLCRKDFKLRFVDGLQPVEENDVQYLGSVVHGCLERWHGRGEKDAESTVADVLDYIDASYPDATHDEKQKKNRHIARTMFPGYVARYPDEDFEVVAMEKEFECPIINPDTGAASRSFYMRGKVDGLVKRDGEYFLLEHKTAASIDGNYLDRLPMDFQITLYAYYLEQFMNIRIAGVI